MLISGKNKCIYYTKDDGHLHEFRTFDADGNVRRMATYVKCSIKESTREKQGKGMRQDLEVAGKNKLPNNWIDFLHNSINKQQLFLRISLLQN